MPIMAYKSVIALSMCKILRLIGLCVMICDENVILRISMKRVEVNG